MSGFDLKTEIHFVIIFGGATFLMMLLCGIYPDTEYHNEIITGKHVTHTMIGDVYYFEFDISYWQNNGEDRRVSEDEYMSYNVSDHYSWKETKLKSARM